MSFWIILFLLSVGFLLGFAFGGFLYSKSVETMSRNHVEVVRKITDSQDERARRLREANNSVLAFVTGGAFEPDKSDSVSVPAGSRQGQSDGGSQKVSKIGDMILVSGEDYVPSRGDVDDDEGVASTVSFEAAGQADARQGENVSSKKWAPSIGEVDQEIVPDSFTNPGEQVFENEDSNVGVAEDSYDVGVYDSTEKEQPETEFVTDTDESNGLVDTDDESSFRKESDNDFSIGTIDVENLIGGGSFKSDFQNSTSATGGSTIYRR